VLDAVVRLQVGSLSISVELTVGDGEVVALLGPNGAGKTTVLRAVAGLQPLAGGRIVLDGEVLDDPDGGVFVPTGERPIGVVFQDYLLFPRMTALDNVAFGLRSRGASKAASRADAAAWLERLGVASIASSRPRTLSGGQAQRVALARALATEPRLLLLDEPLAALDASTRVAVRAELRRHLSTFSGARVLVTHDPLDALVLADRLVILEHGQVTQVGAPADVTARPASRYVAELVGINLLHGTAVGSHEVQVAGGGTLNVADPVPGPDVSVAIRPQAITVSRAEPHTSARNTWQAVVADVEPDRDRIRVRLSGPVPLVAEVTPAAVAELALEPGVSVWASAKAVDLDVYAR
jgi:molybdate transport system ATP-binding protein